MAKFSVTYERWNEAALEAGDTDDRGFVIKDVSLRDAMHLGLEYSRPSWAGACEPDCYPLRNVRWLTFYNWNDCTREQIETGIAESRALHFPPNISEASRLRICRLFGAL